MPRTPFARGRMWIEFLWCESGEQRYTMGVIRDVLLILNAFKSVDKLMAFVERMLKNPNVLPDNLLDDQSKFQVFFHNANRGLNGSIDEEARSIYPPYKTIMLIPRISEMFTTAKHRRFLMHLLGHVTTIECLAAPKDSMTPASNFDQMTFRIKAIMQSYFEQSCCPNVVKTCVDGKTIWYSVKPIKMGEQIFMPKVPSAAILKSIQQRRGMVKLKQLKSKCQCDRCKGKTLSAAQRKQLATDPDYRFIQANKQRIRIERVHLMVDAVVSVLRKFGEWNWCEQIQEVINLLDQFQSYSTIGDMANATHPFNRALALKSEEMYLKAQFRGLMQMVNGL